MGVDGIIGLSSFTNCVVTLNTKAKTITISNPYKPKYVKLENRSGLKVNENNIFIDIEANDKPMSAMVDFYEEKALRINSLAGATVKVKLANIPYPGIKTFAIDQLTSGRVKTIIGKPLLNKGVFSFDIERGRYYFQKFGQREENFAPTLKKQVITIVPGKLNEIDKDYFLKYVNDYKIDKNFKIKGDKPVVIDFWATWCAPCMRMMPIMEQLALKYKDQIIFYKVNVDKEGELRDVFKAVAIPMTIFAPLKGEWFTGVGADSKEQVEEQLKKIISQQ